MADERPRLVRRAPPRERQGRFASARVPGAWARAACLVLLTGVAVVVALTTDIPDVASTRAWLVASGPGGWLIAVGALALALAVPTPRSALAVLAGAAAGFGPGLALIVAGGVLGASLGFGVSRWLGRDALSRLAGARLARVDGLAERRGFLAVVTARLMPVPPFAVVSYAAGLTRVRLWPFVLGTAVGILPSTVFYVGVGASVSKLDEWADRLSGPMPIVLGSLMLLLLGAALFLRLRLRLRLRCRAAGRRAASTTSTAAEGEQPSAA